MTKRVVICLLVLATGLFGSLASRTQAQPLIPPLPADLLFVTTTAADGFSLPQNIVVRVDTQTMEVSTFYVDDEAWELMPLSWSPQGDLLAIYRSMPRNEETYLAERQLCLLDREGILQRCMQDTPPMHWEGEPYAWPYLFPVTWAPDGQTIYFETEYPSEGELYGRRIIEADVTTGETLRVLYDYPEPRRLVLFSDGNHVGIDIGGSGTVNGLPAIINLVTGKQLDILATAPENTWRGHTMLPISPGGHYVVMDTAYDMATYAPGQPPFENATPCLRIILDTGGVIQAVIGDPEEQRPMTFMDKPAWQPDERAIYFHNLDSDGIHLVRYSLPDQELSVLFDIEDWYVSDETMAVSPDGAHLALIIQDELYGARQIAVYYPAGEIYRIPSPYRFGLYPLWVPPLEEELPDFEPLSVCWVRDWNQAQTEWRINNPNPVPLSTDPEVKVRYNWTAYDAFDAQGGVVQSANGWDSANPNPLNTPLAKSLRLEWYLVIDGENTDILGETVVNADESGQCPG